MLILLFKKEVLQELVFNLRVAIVNKNLFCLSAKIAFVFLERKGRFSGLNRFKHNVEFFRCIIDRYRDKFCNWQAIKDSFGYIN